ncbi:unnamed protein product [Arabis nemorensis]|uniref:mRNA cap-binding protein n=1 Tax=Arabis nemorensis TaxID=586526 RepID=A0A565AWG3_9BRAS|nr:unnamed protein product [Arabis nemorensis]
MVVEDTSVSSAITAEENLDPSTTTNPRRKEKDLPAIGANFGDEEGPSKEKKILCDDNVSKKSTTLVQHSHSLQNCWTFWFDNPHSKSNQATWGSSLRSLYTFATIEEFWSLYNNMHPPTKWTPGADLYCFKHQTEPKWEDPICADGGKWTVMFPKAKLDSSWLNTFFPKGTCKNGSACRFRHSMDRDGAEPALFNVPGLTMHQARSSDRRASESNWRFDERRHESGSSSRPEKRARTIPDSREHDPRESFEDISLIRDEKVAGFKRARLEQGHGNIEWQRREGQENVQEQRQQRENIEWQIREVDESFDERRWRERHPHDRQIIEEQRLRDIDTRRKEARSRIEQMKRTVQFN